MQTMISLLNHIRTFLVIYSRSLSNMYHRNRRIFAAARSRSSAYTKTCCFGSSWSSILNYFISCRDGDIAFSPVHEPHLSPRLYLLGYLHMPQAHQIYTYVHNLAVLLVTICTSNTTITYLLNHLPFHDAL